MTIILPSPIAITTVDPFVTRYCVATRGLELNRSMYASSRLLGGISNDPKTLDIGRPTVVGNRDSDVGMFGIGNSEPIASQCLKPITHHHFAHCRMLQTRGTPMSEIEKTNFAYGNQHHGDDDAHPQAS
ncbi:hypothetical protein BAAM0483_00875 [Bifidobacterium animalis subsp. animalis MCC 0483]|uniref:Uncharacterized protein n=1 Tax=Bifidobacterium animalis subsp. animalis MCC 0483 TaxID=1365955 RepID=A0AB34TBC2_9BIFI|nr:hypothetical protein BAAM0483_00875 [Bifidobacterium animalis subsp. animalis MCC 0483]